MYFCTVQSICCSEIAKGHKCVGFSVLWQKNSMATLDEPVTKQHSQDLAP